jgi:hypothetical protein
LVGATGFEPATPCAQGRCATRLRYAPTTSYLTADRRAPSGAAAPASARDGLRSRAGRPAAVCYALAPEPATRRAGVLGTRLPGAGRPLNPMHRRPTVTAALVTALLTSTTLTARQTAASASGTFTVDGNATALHFVWAGAQPGFRDSSREDIRVVVSDVRLSSADAADDFALQRLTRAGALHAIVLIIDADKQIISTGLYDARFKMDSASSAGTNNRLAVRMFTRDRIAGKASTLEPDDVRDVPYTYSVTFDAPIQRAR